MRVGSSDAERAELNELFAALCAIESPSGRERDCSLAIREQLDRLGVAVHEDEAGAAVGGDCGNLYALVPRGGSAAPSGGRPLLLCAHMDTVPLTAPVAPVLVDGAWENAHEAILGADNKAAVAVILMVARRAAREGLPVDLELLFTVAEERALAGARAVPQGLLRSGFGYVFDHATPIGEVIVASPTHYRIEATFRGQAAHAGLRPQAGRSAILAASHAVATMRLGRLDGETTANVGEIRGGTAMNVVPERCTLVAEARSLDATRVEEVVAEMVDRIHDAANLPECECDVDVSVARLFTGYRLAASSPALRVAEAALRDCGYAPERVASGGASDANVFIEQGLPVVNVANGTERAHEPGERVMAAALEEMLDVALTLVHHAATP